MAETRKLNIKLFKKIRDRIAEIPESYDQSLYCLNSTTSPCGTAACLAGEAVICSSPTVEAGVTLLRVLNSADQVPEEAARLLGLPRPAWHDGQPSLYNETARLFACHSDYEVFWPEPFRSDFRSAISARERAKIAVAYLDHIIETGRVLD